MFAVRTKLHGGNNDSQKISESFAPFLGMAVALYFSLWQQGFSTPFRRRR
jgi:hypothetical protein